MSEGVTKTVVGVCTGITERKEGWHQFEISIPGRDYPVKLDTKIEDLIDAARAVKNTGEIATFTYTEKDSGTPNPHRPGSNFLNRYLEGVEAGSHAPEGSQAADAGSTAPSGGDGSGYEPQARYTKEEIKTFEDKERRDFRSRSWAHTMSAFTHTIKTDEEVGDVFARLKPFQRKIYEDICQGFAYDVDDSDVPF